MLCYRENRQEWVACLPLTELLKLIAVRPQEFGDGRVFALPGATGVLMQKPEEDA
jgi:hypothetical protein